MAGEIVESDILEGVAQLGGGLFGAAGNAREIGRDIDQRNLAPDQGRSDGLARHGLDGWLHRRPPNAIRER